MTKQPDLVVVLAASLKSNALGRALSLANLIPSEIEVEIWGPQSKDQWTTQSEVPIRGMNPFKIHKQVKQINDRILEGKHVVFWASKCYPFAAQTLRKVSPNATVIADFDDHDVALAKEFRRLRWRNRFILNPLRAGSPERVSRAQATLLKNADSVTVSSYALAAELGIKRNTTRIPHARPDLRHAADVSAKPNTIGFLGTMRAHKGYEEICAALDSDSLLTCVTFTQDSLPENHKRRWKFLDPTTPLADAYSEIELAVLPMSDSTGAQFQLPAKAIDAAAAAVPIAASKTPVLTEYFGNSLLPVSDWSSLGAKLSEWRKDGTLQRQGSAVHRIWEELLSIDQVQEEVLTIISTVKNK